MIHSRTAGRTQAPLSEAAKPSWLRRAVAAVGAYIVPEFEVCSRRALSRILVGAKCGSDALASTGVPRLGLRCRSTSCRISGAAVQGACDMNNRRRVPNVALLLAVLAFLVYCSCSRVI